MRIVVAGASGVVGKVLVPALVARGHQVLGLVRSATGASLVARAGAEPALVDALDQSAVLKQFQLFGPVAVIHQLTALSAVTDLRDFFRDFDKVFAQTNLLRTRGTDNLLLAGRDVGVGRFVAQSFCGWPQVRQGGPVKTEDDPLDPNPPEAFRRTLAALRYLESTVEAAGDVRGVNLRYGGFYGPGTSLSEGGEMVDQVRRRRLPIIGSGGGIWSFVHINDVASATVAAVESDITGTFNVVDDEPAPVAEWLPELAKAVGANPPFRVPAFLARLILPEHLFVMMTDIRGNSNAKFKRALNWRPEFSTWRDGFRRGLGYGDARSAAT
jgi:2-alkyl-3-oxoalkanoate reductase